MRLRTIIKGLTQQLRTPLYRNALYIMGNQLLLLGAGLGFWLLAAKLYDENDVGLGSATVSAMLLISYLALLGIDYAIIRFLPNADKDSNAMINSCLTIGGIASIIVAVVFVIGLDLWSPALRFLQQKHAYSAAFIACTTGWTVYWIAGRAFIGKRRAGNTLTQGIIFNIFRLVLIVVLASILNHFGIFLSWGIGGLVAVLTGIFILLPRIQITYRPFPNITRRVVVPMLRYAMANYVVALFWFGTIYVLPLLVINKLSEEENAYFFIAWQLANILFSISIAISFSLLAEGSHDTGKLGQDTRRSLKFTFAIVLPAMLLVILFADKMLSVFGSAYAENGADFLRVVAISAIPVSFNQIYFGVKRVEMKMKSVIAINAFTAIGTVVLTSVLLSSRGIEGVGIAWLSSHSVASVMVIFMCFPRTRKRLAHSAAKTVGYLDFRSRRPQG